MKIKDGIFVGNSGQIVTTVDIGAIVKRGPDWKWDNQDGHGYGKIASESLPGWVMVYWDCGKSNAYRIGDEGAYDLCYV